MRSAGLKFAGGWETGRERTRYYIRVPVILSMSLC